MKCNRIAIYGWKSKNHSKSKPRVLFSTLDINTIYPVIYDAWDISHTETCDGEIKSDIILENIPYYGGSDPSVEVRFICNKCRQNYAGDFGLPSDIDTLNKFLTQIISKL